MGKILFTIFLSVSNRKQPRKSVRAEARAQPTGVSDLLL